MYATVPPGYSEVDLGEVALAGDQRLLVVIAPDEEDVNGHIGLDPKDRKIDFNVLIGGSGGSTRRIKGWTADKAVTATIGDKLVLTAP